MKLLQMRTIWHPIPLSHERETQFSTLIDPLVLSEITPTYNDQIHHMGPSVLSKAPDFYPSRIIQFGQPMFLS
jgi:hypothetical protein